MAQWETKSLAFPPSLGRQARKHGEAEILLACDRAARPRRGDKLASRPQLRYRDADRARQPVRILRRSAHETMPVAPPRACCGRKANCGRCVAGRHRDRTRVGWGKGVSVRVDLGGGRIIK